MVVEIGWGNTLMRQLPVLLQGWVIVPAISAILTVVGVDTLPPLAYNARMDISCLTYILSAWLGSSTLRPVPALYAEQQPTTCASILPTTSIENVYPRAPLTSISQSTASYTTTPTTNAI